MTGEISKTAVYLTDGELELFRQFQQHYPVVKAIIEGGVEAVRSGTATLYFDPQGTLTKIETQEVVYRSGKPVL